MLDEGKQIELTMIIPQGTNVTAEQKRIREKIGNQQQALDKLNQQDLKSGPTNKNHNSNWRTKIQTLLTELGVNRFGVTRINDDYTFENSTISSIERNAIVVVLPMDYHKMQSVPSIESATEILRVYHKVGEVVLQLTEYLQKHGIQATGHHPLGNSSDYHHILMPPHAMAAGLGEKGRTGLFIDHKLGPLVRLGIVTTSLDLELDHPVDRGVNAFCHRCRYCVPHCPPRALPPDKYLESLKIGVPMKFTIDGDKCIKYFAKHFGCGKCIVKCVLAQPNQTELEKRLNRIEIWYHRWVKSGELFKLQQASI